MIFLFTGDDVKNKRTSIDRFLQSFSKNEILSINRNNFNKTQIESLYSGASLFSPKHVVVFDNIFEYEDNRDFVFEKLELMSESESLFIFLEGKLNKTILDIFRKIRSKKVEINIFELPKEKKERFDNFLVANAFGQKDKLNMWIYFRQAIDLGVGMEEIVGVLFWKIKDMLIKRNFSKFSEVELKGFVSRLSYLLPEARKSGRDAESAFEQFILEVF